MSNLNSKERGRWDEKEKNVKLVRPKSDRRRKTKGRLKEETLGEKREKREFQKEKRSIEPL